MHLFPDLKKGFQTIFTDKLWLNKILFGGFLLINPFLIILGLILISPGKKSDLLIPLFYGTLAFNVFTFFLPLGFTYEVLRRARTGSAPQLPDWNSAVLSRYAKEGAVKLIIAITTLLLPIGIWIGICHFIFIQMLGLSPSLLNLFYPPALLFGVPFCGVACCRWLDGASVLDSALNYSKNWTIFCMRIKEFLLASLFLTGLNTVLCSFIITIPFAAVFGLCLVDWFGPIYADAVRNHETTS